jgi:outer membrane protein
MSCLILILLSFVGVDVAQGAGPAAVPEPVAGSASAVQAAPLPVFTLEEALALADARPAVRLQQANARAAGARADQARSALLPQVQANADWSRDTTNAAPTPGGGASWVADSTMSDSFRASLGASQLIWKGGSANRSWKAARSEAEASSLDATSSVQQARWEVRSAYFFAMAAKELVGVAREALSNQERHLAQVEAFIQAGTRPEIDRAQARADLANSRVDLIHAENTFRLARHQLDQATGRMNVYDYDVADEDMPAVQGEDVALDVLLARARSQRPDLAAEHERLVAVQATLRAAEGGYSPEISASASVGSGGAQLDREAINWGGGLTLGLPIFAGGDIRANVAEARASFDAEKARDDILELQVRTAVAQAQADVQAASAALGASDDALAAARERLSLAEGRYKTGVGSAIELGDAQLEATRAAAQKVQARLDLATARATLLMTIGEQ